MTVAIKQIHPVFAGEVSGVDLTKPLSREEAVTIEEGMNRYGVLVFRDQNITDEQQIAFTRNFGELEVKAKPGNIRKASESRLGAGIGDLSNLTKDGKIIEATDRQWFFKLGDRLWHSDSSYAVIPAKFSALSARAIPTWGGNTDFADMRAAYDALDERTKAEVEDLICEHSLMYSRAAVGFTDLTPEEIANFKPVLQRLVRTHQATGAQVAVPVVACRRHRRLDDPGGARLPARADRACDAARVRLLAPVAAVRPRHVGQSRDHASRQALRPQRGARHAPHDPGRRSSDRGAAGRSRLSFGPRQNQDNHKAGQTKPVPREE